MHSAQIPVALLITMLSPLKVIDISSKTLDIIIEKNGLKHEYSGDNSRLTSEVNDLSFVKIDDAIQNLYHWYSHNTSVIKKELFAY